MDLSAQAILAELQTLKSGEAATALPRLRELTEALVRVMAEDRRSPAGISAALAHQAIIYLYEGIEGEQSEPGRAGSSLRSAPLGGASSRGRTRCLGSMADGKEQHVILIDGREVHFVFGPQRHRVCTVTDGPVDAFAERLRRKAALAAGRAAGLHGARNGRSFRTDPLSRFAMRM